MIRALARRYRLFGRRLRTRLIRKLVGSHAIGVLYDAENGRILVTPGDNSMAKRLGRKGSYGGSSLRALEPHLTPESRVLFVGAHVGTLLIPIARRVAHVRGIEANPRTLELLRLNLKLNDVDNARLHHCAAGDAEREVEFLMNTSNSGGSKIQPRVEHHDFVHERPERVTVPMRRVDDVLDGEPYDIIVMDVEGAETLALGGMPRTLEACRVLHIEYIVEHLEFVAGVTLDAFLEPLSLHFDAACLVEDGPARVYPRERFREMLEGVRSSDVLFLKADAAAVASAWAGSHAGVWTAEAPAQA